MYNIFITFYDRLNEIKNINLPDIADDNQLKNLFSAVKTIASLSTKIIYLD